MDTIDQIQQKINACDKRLIEILTARMNYVQEVIEFKKKNNCPILSPEQKKMPESVVEILTKDNPYQIELLDIFDSIRLNSQRVQSKNLFSYNIMLIGFMGTGKSTISHYLSSILAMDEVEMDELIVKRQGMSINDIFQTFGEDYFRECESDLLSELQHRNNVIVSCGGGVVLRDDNVGMMNKSGRIVLLDATPEAIYHRLKDDRERPILANNISIDFITNLMTQRREKYEHAADITIQTDHKTIHQICEEIIKQLILLD